MTKTIIQIVAIVALIAVGVWAVTLNARDYNHGICPKCGEHYEEEEIIIDGDSYIRYNCPNCGHHGRICDIYKD